MATTPQPDPTQSAGGAPDAGGAPGGASPQQPSQAPASPTQMMLAKVYMLLKQLAQQDASIAAELAEAGQAIQKAQTKLVTQPQSQPSGANPAY